MIRELPEGKPALNLFRLKVDSSAKNSSSLLQLSNARCT